MEDKPKKKIIGSVAVDSETGLENYNQPKQTMRAAGQTVNAGSEEELRDNFQTPNYGEENERTESQNLAGVPDEFLHLFEHDPSEVIAYQAKRHPIGVAFIFAAALAAAAVILGFYGLIITGDSTGKAFGVSDANMRALGGLVVLILLVFVAGLSYLAAYVYRKSRIILTNQKIVLIQYHSLIAREISQLNIGEVEDVNVSQPSILDRIFKKGKITIETAGEQNNYVLTNVENPYEFAKRTIQMHEGSIVEYGN